MEYNPIDLCDVNGCDEIAHNKVDLGNIHNRVVHFCDFHKKLFNERVMASIKDQVIGFMAHIDER